MYHIIWYVLKPGSHITTALSDWVLQQQVMVFTFNIISFKNMTAKIKKKKYKRRRYV